MEAAAEGSDVKLLTVRVNSLRTWYRPGLVCIGDAAHAMSPVGGVGINLAIQDAVAAANILARTLREGTASVGDLAKVQRRREFPTRLTQRLQALMQKQQARSLGRPNLHGSHGPAVGGTHGAATPHSHAPGRYRYPARAREVARCLQMNLVLRRCLSSRARTRAEGRFWGNVLGRRAHLREASCSADLVEQPTLGSY